MAQPQKLLTQQLREQLPELYATEMTPLADKVAVAKFFTPDSSWTWYAIEFDGQDTFFGYVQGLEGEFGYFSLNELEEARGPWGMHVERDAHFQPTPLIDLDPELRAKAESNRQPEEMELQVEDEELEQSR